MKTITIKQPWALLVAMGIKNIENRTWKLPEKYKGKRVLIHASAKNEPSFNFTYEQSRAMDHLSEDLVFPTSAIIGSVIFTDCVINHPSIWAEKSYYAQTNKNNPDCDDDRIVYNWVLEHPILFPEPIPTKGKLSFWDYPNILAEPEEKDGPLFCHCQVS